MVLGGPVQPNANVSKTLNEPCPTCGVSHAPGKHVNQQRQQQQQQDEYSEDREREKRESKPKED